MNELPKIEVTIDEKGFTTEKVIYSNGDYIERCEFVEVVKTKDLYEVLILN